MEYIIVFLSIVIGIVIGIRITMKLYEQKYILNLEELPKDYDAVIVLGAGIRVDGQPCDLLKDRIYTGAKVFENGYCKNVLLTGDNREVSRNEVDTMKKWLVDNYLKNSINNENILLDNEGFCTYDSMDRAKNVFEVKKAIISTNRYHLPRAIYLARKKGIEAYGIVSDLRIYDRMKKYKKREFLAQIKDFIKVNFFKINNHQ